MRARHKIALALVVVSWFACSCAGTEPARPDADSSHQAETRLHSNKHPHPEVRLSHYFGSLCPEDSLDFSASDGGLTITTSTDIAGQASCELHLELTVPAGFRFRRPLFFASGWAINDDDEDRAPNLVRMTYGLDGMQLTSEHDLPGARPSSSETGSFVLADTPQLTVPECSDPSEPMVVDLSVSVDVDIPAGNMMRIVALDGELELGVQWTTCREGFDTAMTR